MLYLRNTNFEHFFNTKYFKDSVMQMKTTRVHSLNNFVGYLEAVEDVVKLGNLNCKLVAEDFYNSFCEHLFFATLEVCKSEFHQILVTEDCRYVMNELNFHIDWALQHAIYGTNSSTIRKIH